MFIISWPSGLVMFWKFSKTDVKSCMSWAPKFQTIVSKKLKTHKFKNFPGIDKLKSIIWEIPTTQIAKQYGVSGKMVEKWCIAYNIQKPSRGYWTKKFKNFWSRFLFSIAEKSIAVRLLSLLYM